MLSTSSILPPWDVGTVLHLKTMLNGSLLSYLTTPPSDVSSTTYIGPWKTSNWAIPLPIAPTQGYLGGWGQLRIVPPDVQPYYGLYAGLSTTQFLLGTPLNLLCLFYFAVKKKRSNMSLIMSCINAVDSIICCMGIFTALSSFFDGAAMFHGP